MTTLVTGSSGCIGAWVLRHLVRQGQPVVAFDLARGGHRIDYLLPAREQQAIHFVQGDLSDFRSVLNVFEQHTVSQVVHLAALQVPFCKADPVRGAQVNVVGTVNVFEAARRTGVQQIVYASSTAIFGTPDDYGDAVLSDDAPQLPRTLYGVYKQANEATARVYYADYQISSVGLRPCVVYGVGRDQGLTSDPTKAMLHAVAGKPYHIAFGGQMQFQLASDTALQFIEAARTPLTGALTFNMGGQVVSVAQVVDLIRKQRPHAQITCAEAPLPFPANTDNAGLRAHLRVHETPLATGVQRTMGQFADLLQSGQITLGGP